VFQSLDGIDFFCNIYIMAEGDTYSSKEFCPGPSATKTKMAIFVQFLEKIPKH
jgi:hypothetical protein